MRPAVALFDDLFYFAETPRGKAPLARPNFAFEIVPAEVCDCFLGMLLESLTLF